MGGTAEQVERIALADRRVRTTARHGAGTAGIGLGLTTALAGLASWGALTLGVRATHGGHLDGALLAVLALVPLAAFELVAPLPAGTQALQRCRTAAGRVFAAMDAPSPGRGARRTAQAARRQVRIPRTRLARGLGRLPGNRPVRPARGGPRPHSGTTRGAGRAQRSGQVDAGRRPRPLPARRQRRGDARRRAAGTVVLRRGAPGGRAGRAEPAPLRHEPGREPADRTARRERRRPRRRAGPGGPGRLAGRAAHGFGHRGRVQAAPASRAVSASASLWPAPCSPSSRFSSSTSRPSTSTRRRPMPSRPTFSSSPRATRPCSSPTASGAWTRSTRSSSSTRDMSSNGAAMSISCPPADATPVCGGTN